MCPAQRCPPSAATCRCRAPRIGHTHAGPFCYECGLPRPATVRCPACKGIGTVIETQCWRCHGAGSVPARHSAAKLDAIVRKVKEA